MKTFRAKHEYVKISNNNLLLLNPKMMTNMHFCPKGPAICKIFQQIVMKWGNSKQEKFSNNLVSKESSWLTALFGVILPFKDKTQIKFKKVED